MTVSAYRNVGSESNLHFVSAIEGVNLSQNTLPYVFAARRTVGLLDFTPPFPMARSRARVPQDGAFRQPAIPAWAFRVLLIYSRPQIQSQQMAAARASLSFHEPHFLHRENAAATLQAD
jgi:hypothetical protein